MDTPMLVERIAPLRLAALAAHSSYVGGPHAQKTLIADVARFLQLAADTGGTRTLITDGALRAHLTWWKEARKLGSGLQTFVATDLRLGDAQAESWLVEEFAALVARCTDVFDVTVDPSCASLPNRLLPLGMQKVAATLVGETATGLKAVTDRAASPEERGLQTRELSQGDIESVVELERRACSVRADLHWFGPIGAFVDQERSRLCQYFASDSSDPRHVLVNPDGEVVGYYGARIEEHAYWGRSAGLVLALAPALQRRGLARPLYQHLLTELLERKVPRYRGMTAQPAVLKLADEMGREVTSIVLRFEASQTSVSSGAPSTA